MTDFEEKIKTIEEEIKKTPYHKGTEHHIGKLRAKLAKLKDQQLLPKKSGGQSRFALKKEGDATCILLGFPSVGKSTLLNQLTAASSKVGDYDFTTVTVIPGILPYRGAQIQILDLPGIIGGAAAGKGKGRQIFSAARVADLLLILLDANKPQQESIIRQELHQAGVRINSKPPAIIIKKMPRGGLQISAPSNFSLSVQTVKEMAQEFGLVNAEIIIKENLDLEKLVDAFSQNRAYLSALFLVNKIDLIKNQARLKQQFPDHLLISSKEKIGLEEIKMAIWKKLDLIRVYLKPKGKEADQKHPLILKRGVTVLEAAQKISTQLAQEIKGAKIFGQEACFPGQVVGLNYPLKNESILTLLT